MGPHRSLRRIAFVLVIALCLSVAARAQEDSVAMASVHGRAIDRDGKPMAGCAVGLFDPGQRFDTKELLAAPRATTDAQGRYRLEAKQNHYRVVVVTTKGHQVCVQRLQGEAGAVRHMPDALMLPGTSLRGRVRDAAGQPIVGAQVRVEDPLTADTFVSTWFESQARSDAKGIFEVPGVPRTGLRVTASAPGFPAVSRLAAHDSPLDFTLTATGFVRGRVLDANGKPVPKASVKATTAEYQDAGERIETDDEGHFALTVPRTLRFRVTAYEGNAPFRQFTSALLHGPADDVVLAAAVTAARGARKVTVRCVDAASKAPIEDFHASWRAIDPKASVLVLMNHPDARQPFHGEATFDVAADRGDKSLGTIVVDAPGHGYAIVPIPDDPTEPLAAELPAECFLVGLVLDAETGKPAAGAAVRALPRTSVYGSGPDPWKAGAITDAGGRYRLGGLPPGDYDVQVYGRDRPAARSAPATVDPVKETTLDLEVPKARFLEFELVGEIPANCLGTITWQGFRSSIGGGGGVMLRAMMPAPPTVPLAGPRTKKLGPLGNDQFRAILQLPTRDRLGSCQTIDLGEVGDTDGKIEVPDLQQYVHTGRVRLPPDVPPERIAILAHRIVEKRREDPFAGMWMQQPFAVCLGSDGGFVIDLQPGRYAVQLVDLATGIVFFTEPEDREVNASKQTLEIVPTVHWLEITLAPKVAGDDVVVQSLGFDVQRPRDGKFGALLRNARGKQLDSSAVPVRHGELVHRWLVPGGPMAVQPLQAFDVLRLGSDSQESAKVAATDLEIRDPVHRVTFLIPAPPSDAELERPAAK